VGATEGICGEHDLDLGRGVSSSALLDDLGNRHEINSKNGSKGKWRSWGRGRLFISAGRMQIFVSSAVFGLLSLFDYA